MADRVRYPWMYALRGIAILLVVSHHSLQALIQYAGSAPALLIQLDEFIGPFRMPALMFLSGMLLGRSLNKLPGRYFWGKLAMIGWPYLLWSLVVLLIADAVTPLSLVKLLYAPTTVYWFLWFLLAFYAIAYVTRRVPPPVLIAVSLVLAVLAPHVIRAPRFFLLFAFFIGGHWAMTRRDAWESRIRRPWVVALCLVLATGTGLMAAAGYPIRYSIFSIPGVLAAICVAVVALPSTDRWRVMAPIRYVGENSLIYYVLHWPTILLLVQLLVAVEVVDAVAYGALFVGSLLVATVFVTVSSRVPYVRALFRWPQHAT